ncbi:hypothetical protein DFH28DRAFT_898678 [Melampsora americana]|nr:hypothetical protein DFH28DRAFT_898678 [Melampsora americana]
MKAFQKHLQIGSSSQTKPQAAPSSSIRIDEQSQPQWVAFPPLPSPAKNSFSTAVQYVSTTFKPFSDSSARISTPVSSTQNNRNALAAAPRLPAISSTTLSHPSPLLKRVRTQTDATQRINLSRKRSKSDIGQSPSQPRKTDELPHLHSRYPIIENEVFEKNLALSASLNSRPLFYSRQKSYGSSASLASNLSTAPPSRRRVDVQNPGVLLRQRHRTLANFKPSEPLCRQMSLRSVPIPASPYTQSNSRPSTPEAASFTRQGRQRAKTIGSVLSVDSASKPRSTYIGGMGEYLNKEEVKVTGRVLQERRAVSRRVRTPKLTIDVSLCAPALEQGPTSAPAQGWYNRLILSPISSASSSVFSFLGHSHHNHNNQGVEETPKIEEEDEEKGDSSMELFPSPPQELYPFRSWDF